MLGTTFMLSSIRRILGTQQIMRRLEMMGRRPMDEAVVMAIRNASPDSYFRCIFNDRELLIPQHTLRTMAHCIHAQIDAPFIVNVESNHMNWLHSKLHAGDVFLDIGAATGAMTLPIAASSPGVHIIAFEPSRTANRVLRETLRLNKIDGVEIFDSALSDCGGRTQFVEFEHDPTGQTPFQPEASAILAPTTENLALPHQHYDVPVTTLDEFFVGRNDASKVRAVKIDVEGFETKVLQGATRFFGFIRLMRILSYVVPIS